MNEIERLMEAALELARLAGASAMKHFRRGLPVDRKADGSPVTDADRGAEQLARDWLERRFPEDGILGEEFGTLRPGAKRRWILDPIDGTRSFVRGVPLWGTLVAVAEGERVLVGAAVFPALGESLVAGAGAGCRSGDGAARVSDVARLDEAVVLTTDGRMLAGDDGPLRRLAREAGTVRTWGDCSGYLLVATGRAEAMVEEQLAPWDAAPLQPLIDEAGGRFTDLDGRRTAFGRGAVATNRALASVVRERLGVPAPAADTGGWR